jgi:hypothetical protein
MFLWVWTLDLAFGGFTLCPAEGYTYYILLAIFISFFGLLTKFGHSIPRPLDFDGHSVKRPLESDAVPSKLHPRVWPANRLLQVQEMNWRAVNVFRTLRLFIYTYYLQEEPGWLAGWLSVSVHKKLWSFELRIFYHQWMGLVTDEPIDIQDMSTKITHHFRGLHENIPQTSKQSRRKNQKPITTCNRLDLWTLGSRSINVCGCYLVCFSCCPTFTA